MREIAGIREENPIGGVNTGIERLSEVSCKGRYRARNSYHSLN